jgi:protein SCO1
MARRFLALVVGLVVAGSACQKALPPAKEYTLKGQILAVLPDRQEITIRHEDIPGFMPAMTMNYPVAGPELMKDRTPGELVTATLEVRDATGRLTAITHTGTAPLPDSANTAMLAAGLLGEGDEVPDTALIDQSDRRRSFSEWKGTLTLITFIYTNCPLPNFCPLMDQNFATIQRVLTEDPALKDQVKLVSVTFDPEHDTPKVLAAHAKMRQADPAVWTFLTGDSATIGKFVARFGVATLASDVPGQVTHNLRTVLIGRDGRIIKFYTGNAWTPGAVLADMRAAVKAS